MCFIVRIVAVHYYDDSTVDIVVAITITDWLTYLRTYFSRKLQ